MRFVDIAVAGAIGLSSIAAMLAFSPQPAVSASQQLVEQASLRGLIFDFVSVHGLSWVKDAPAKEVCSSLAAASNATVSLSATIDSVPCGPPPPSGACALAIEAGTRHVTFEAWYDAER